MIRYDQRGTGRSTVHDGSFGLAEHVEDLEAIQEAYGHEWLSLFGRSWALWRKLSEWAVYFGVTGALSRRLGRPWSFVWILGLPGLRLAFLLWWCKKHGIDPLIAEPKDEYYELRGWVKT